MSNELSDRELVSHALTMWANYVETGEVGLSAKDAGSADFDHIKPRALELDQMKMIIRLRELSIKALKMLTVL